jgi:hypothetical protein
MRRLRLSISKKGNYNHVGFSFGIGETYHYILHSRQKKKNKSDPTLSLTHYEIHLKIETWGSFWMGSRVGLKTKIVS